MNYRAGAVSAGGVLSGLRAMSAEIGNLRMPVLSDERPIAAMWPVIEGDIQRLAGRPPLEPLPPTTFPAPRPVAPLVLEPDPDAPETMRTLAARIAGEAGFTVADLRGPRCWRPLVLARQRFMAEARDLGRSTTQIGAFLGRDHTTVCEGSRKYRLRVSA